MKGKAAARRRRPMKVNDLRVRLDELQATLDAIRSGEVDALIVNGPLGEQVYSLKGAEQPYREFIERMGEGAVTLDAAGTILYCNKRFAQMIGVPLQKLISTDILVRVAEGDRDRARQLLTDKGLASGTIHLLGRKGQKLPVRIAASAMKSADQEIWSVVITDLTEQEERAALQDAMARLQESQEKLKTQYQEVVEIRSKLENANAAKDEFLAALSHELRTPLTPVLLMANALAIDPMLPPALRGDLEMIRRNVELEARLIDDLLDLTRVTRGKLQVAPQTVDLHETLGLALDICQSDAGGKRLTFINNLEAKRHHVAADPVRLQQIFWNLIRNAVKFTPTGGTITISTANAGEGAASHIVVMVRDTGIGIPANALKHIFNAFDQGSTEINRRFGGLGLGLTITKRLVELHGGSIEAASDGADAGAAFTVTLPAIAAPSNAATAQTPGPHARTRALRILLVEDHDDTRRNMARLLTSMDHSVVAAKSAASAMHEAGTASFDLVISDIGLPDESGLELMRKLREQHGLKGICLSGYGMEDDIVRSREAGFLEHLTKPINFQRLEMVLAQMAEKTL